MDAFAKYGINMPTKTFLEFDKEDQTKILTFKTGKIVPRVLKELDIYINHKEQFKARQVSLLLKGKKDKRENYNMRGYVSEYGEFFDELEGSIIDSLEDILEQVVDDMNAYNKDLTRKDKFFNTLDSFVGEKFIFIIGIISLGEFLINKYGYIKNGRYLGEVLRARTDLKNKITKVFKDMNKGIYTKEKANEIFKDMIEEKVQEQMKMDMNLYEEIKNEDDLSRICEEESVDLFIFTLMENVRKKATKQERFAEMKML